MQYRKVWENQGDLNGGYLGLEVTVVPMCPKRTVSVPGIEPRTTRSENPSFTCYYDFSVTKLDYFKVAVLGLFHLCCNSQDFVDRNRTADPSDTPRVHFNSCATPTANPL